MSLSDWMQLYLGKKDGRHVLGCACIWVVLLSSHDDPTIDNEFTQVMKGLQGERLRQAFRYFDKDGDGYIRPEEFKRIIMVCGPCASQQDRLYM
jgi:solute carrier family 25 aspartate/glutamate transporter 12/13